MNCLKWLAFALALPLFSCNNSTRDGGPCQYEKDQFEARVMSITPLKDGKVTVLLDFNVSSLALEDQNLADFVSDEVNEEFVKSNRIVEGNVYTGTVSEVASGNCTPIIVSFNSDLSAK